MITIHGSNDRPCCASGTGSIRVKKTWLKPSQRRVIVIQLT
ncbi:hypothetical protein OK016_24010 [Vibrio chagasii]|nr:hypothetical protein [Vibrio chagasii]